MEGRIISTFKKILAFLGALIVVGAIVVAGTGITAAAPGSDVAIVNTAAVERGAVVLTQADPTPVPPLGVPFDPAASTPITTTTNLEPASTYLLKDQVILIHGTLADPSSRSVTFTFNSNTEVLDLVNKDAALGFTRNIGDDPLAVTVTGNDVTVSTLNGAPIGPAVIFVVKAKADGLVGVDYDYAELKGLLTGVSYTQYAEINQRNGAVTHLARCNNYENSEPLAPVAWLYVLNDNTAVLPALSATADGRAVTLVVSADDYNDPIVIVASDDGLALGEFVTVCLTGTDTTKPFGVK